MKAAGIIITAALILGVVSCSGSGNQLRDETHGTTEYLNYEYTNRYIKQTVREDHFELALYVESPVVVTPGTCAVEKIHRRGDVRGNALLRVTVNSDGTVRSLKFVKHAGAGLDEYAEKIVKRSTFVPVRHHGRDQNAGFVVEVRIGDF